MVCAHFMHFGLRRVDLIWGKSTRSKLVSFGLFSPFLAKSTCPGGQVDSVQVNSVSGKLTQLKSTWISPESTRPRLDCTVCALLFQSYLFM